MQKLSFLRYGDGNMVAALELVAGLRACANQLNALQGTLYIQLQEYLHMNNSSGGRFGLWD